MMTEDFIEVVEVEAEDVEIRNTIYVVATWYDSLGWCGMVVGSSEDDAVSAARQSISRGDRTKVLKIEVPE